MAAIPQRSTAASRPTVHLVLQPSRVKLWPFSGGQVVNRPCKAIALQISAKHLNRYQ